MKLGFICVFIIFFANACYLGTNRNTDLVLNGTWRLFDVDILDYKSESGDSFLKMANLKNIVKAGDVFSFFANGEYSNLKGNGKFVYGNWKFSEENSEISFTDSGRINKVIPIKLEDTKSGKSVFSMLIKRKNIVLKFVKESDPLADLKNDPLYSSNNQWRIKPKQAETDEEITKRLSNYIKHLALILKAALDRKQDIVSFEFSKGPVKIYNGGIGIHPYSIVPTDWKNGFYNEKDASAAYSQYEKYLRTNSYKGGAVGDWMQDDYNILLSIFSDISQPQLKIAK